MVEKYKYFYEDNGQYCYPNTDVLKNKLNIRNDEVLSDVERKLVSLRIDELFDRPIRGNFDLNHLKAIHKYLFQDIYIWAGKCRKCAIAKKDLFCLPQYIESYAKEIFVNLKEKNYFIDYEYAEKINSLVQLFADINALHPFREGNGRVQREFIECLSKVNGIYLDLTNVNNMDMIIASHESVNGDNSKMLIIFKNNSKRLSKEEQIEYINIYCSSKIIKQLKNR